MPAQQITVRPAEPGDVPAIVEFQLAMARETEGKDLDAEIVLDGVSTLMHSPGLGRYLVAEAGGSVAGSLLITYEWSDWRNATFWWIQSVFVDAARRRRGVYRAMHDRVFEEARATEGVCGVRLYVDRDNHGAQHTYNALGMTKSHYEMYEVDFVT